MVVAKVERERFGYLNMSMFMYLYKSALDESWSVTSVLLKVGGFVQTNFGRLRLLLKRENSHIRFTNVKELRNLRK